MTSSSRRLLPGQPKWDSSKHEFKSHYAMCEPGLISILFLAHKNHEITEYCLNSTLESLSFYKGEVEWCFMENGEDDNNWGLFESLDIERKKLIRSKNWGIMSALNDLWSISRGEYCLTLENDFWNSYPSFNFLQKAKDILDEDSEIGIVHLRSITDPFENWGFGKKTYLPFSCIKCEQRSTSKEENYLAARYENMYNNNPQLMRKALWMKCGHFNEPILGSCPKHDESHYQIRINKTNIKAAHIINPVYLHVGGSAKQMFLSQGGKI